MQCKEGWQHRYEGRKSATFEWNWFGCQAISYDLWGDTTRNFSPTSGTIAASFHHHSYACPFSCCLGTGGSFPILSSSFRFFDLDKQKTCLTNAHWEHIFIFTSHILHVCDDKTCYWFSQSLPEIIWVPFSFLSFSGCLVYRYWNSDNKVGPLLLQRSGLDWTLPSFLDSVLTFGIILHGLYSSNADANISLIPLSQLFRPELAQAGLSFIYAVAGLYCYFSGLALAPYRAFYALAIIGGITTSFRLRDKQARAKGEVGVNRHHFHRHWNGEVCGGGALNPCWEVVYILFLVCYLGFRIDTACPYDMHMCKLKQKKKSSHWATHSKVGMNLGGYFSPSINLVNTSRVSSNVRVNDFLMYYVSLNPVFHSVYFI